MQKKRHKLRDALGYAKQLFEVALIYSLTGSNWFIDRVLAITRKKKKNGPLRGLISRFTAKLDDSQRFVYSQAWQQANWLTSRAERPCDKSSSNHAKRDVLVRGDLDCSCGELLCPYGGLFTDLRMFRETRSGLSRSTFVDDDGSGWETSWSETPSEDIGW
jgi:hypothetical protein